MPSGCGYSAVHSTVTSLTVTSCFKFSGKSDHLQDLTFMTSAAERPHAGPHRRWGRPNSPHPPVPLQADSAAIHAEYPGFRWSRGLQQYYTGTVKTVSSLNFRCVRARCASRVRTECAVPLQMRVCGWSRAGTSLAFVQPCTQSDCAAGAAHPVGPPSTCTGVRPLPLYSVRAGRFDS